MIPGERVNIKAISNNELFNKINNNKTELTENSGKNDRIEFSQEGKDLAKLELSNQRLQELRGRIASKFYNSDTVLSKIAEKISDEIK